MNERNAIHLAAALVIVVSCQGLLASTESDLDLHVEAVTPSMFYCGSQIRTNVELADHIDIQIGEPVSVRVTLANTGSVDTDPMTPFLAELGPVVFYARLAEDGAEPFVLPAEWSWSCLGSVEDHAIAPGQEVDYETYFYTSSRSYEFNSEGKLETVIRYAFPSEGEYEIYGNYFTGSFQDFEGSETDWTVPGLPMIQSNRITITVGPPIDSWDVLETNGILEAFRAGPVWPGLQSADAETRAAIDLVISDLNLDWLTTMRQGVQTDMGEPVPIEIP